MVEKLAEQERHESMRGWFAYHLHARMLKDSHIWVVTGDLGYGMFDRIKYDQSGNALVYGPVVLSPENGTIFPQIAVLV